ncbi:MAG TPA: ABC-2 family transporter protein [Thermomicrobiales bacterium]|nr:ABC-2 family transporter protein [Thermomicrobiales bacterium]
MRLYVEVARRAFARYLTYRSANVAGLITNGFFGVLISAVFIAAYAGRGVEAGWTEEDALTFVWLAQALLMPVHVFAWWEIALTIRSGDVVSDLSKPFDYYAFWLSHDYGRALYHTLFRGIPTLTLGWLLFDIRLPNRPEVWLAFLISVGLAIWISFGLRFLANVAAFWLLDYRGAGMALLFFNAFLSGQLVPLVYWPETVREIVVWLPFAGLVQTPVEVFLGKASGVDLAGLLLLQVSWGIVLMGACRLLLALAVRRVVIQGG